MPVEAPVTTASLRVSGIDLLPLCHAGLQHDFDAAILLFAEGFVEFGTLVETDAVRDYKGGIDLAPLDPLYELREVMLHRGLRHSQRQTAIEC